MTQEEKIRANAKLVVDRCSSLSGLDTRFGYNRDSVKWVDGFIERQRTATDVNSDGTAMLIQVLGSYLGECVIHAYGGSWKERDDQWGVSFDDSNVVFPFNKVWKQFHYGHEDSIFSFFEMIPLVFKNLKADCHGLK